MLNLYDRCFVEHKEYSFAEFKDLIPNELFLRGICVKEGKNLIFKCTGFIIVQNEIFVIFPKGYVIPDEDNILKKHVRLLIDVLIKYSRQKNKLDPIEADLLGGIGENQNFIATAFWLIRDYFDYGIIDFQKMEYGFNQSASVNWARTIKGTTPVISNQRPVYLNFITKKNIRFANVITQIHQYAVENCLALYGWLFGYDDEMNSIRFELPCDEDLAIHLLDLEAEKTFEDRKLNLFMNLKEFIIGSHNHSKDSVLTFVTPYFHTIWEKICYFIFADDTNNVPALPKPYWKVNGNYADTEQIPDVMFRVDNTLFILDAKYYRVDFAPKKLPGWGDLVKQFYYRHTLIEDEEDLIENIFIFPGYCNDKIEYLGYAAIEGKPSYGKIHGYVLDIYKAMDFYLKDNRGNIREKLINLRSSHQID